MYQSGRAVLCCCNSPSISIALTTTGALLSDLYKRHTDHPLGTCYSWIAFIKHLLLATLEGETSKEAPEVRVEQTTHEAEPHKNQSSVQYLTVTLWILPVRSLSFVQGCIRGHICDPLGRTPSWGQRRSRLTQHTLPIYTSS